MQQKNPLKLVSRLARRILSVFTSDPRALEAIAVPVFRVGAWLPGNGGAFCDQMAMQWSRAERSADSVRRFHAELSALPEGAVCFDLGANVGEVTELMAGKAHIVHAFEPDPWSFARLSERVGHLPNVVLHQVAVGVADGKITLFRAAGLADDPALSLGSSTVPADRLFPVETCEVDVIDLEAFILSLGVPVALVKMDIEGAEVAILEKLLQSPSLGLISSIFVEIHSGLYPEQILPVARLRRQYARLDSPRVDFDWP